jgi:hypothetical protein
MDVSYSRQPKSREFYRLFCGVSCGHSDNYRARGWNQSPVRAYVENSPCERVQEHEGSYQQLNKRPCLSDAQPSSLAR